jgi:superfamily II DNA or RNA helicase/CRISPR/Cas system-associated exonuclease Cas4 (RecB family)
MKYDFNISYSAISQYFGCQRQFWYTYVAKVPSKPDITAYGDAGNVVHSVLQHGYFDPITVVRDLFEQFWNDAKLSTTNKGNFNRLLNKEQYWNAVLNGLAKKYKITKFEEKFEIKDDHLIKGFLDASVTPEIERFTTPELQIIAQNPELYEDKIVVDWKTNSSVDEIGHTNQMKFYAYLWYRKYGKLPKKFIWEYVKIGQKLERVMTMTEVMETRDKIQKFINDIYSKQSFNDWTPSPDGKRTNCSDGVCNWCPYKERCRSDMNNGSQEEHFKLLIKKGKIYFANPTTELFNEVIDKYFSYEVPNKDFVIRALKRKGREWDGIVHLKKHGAYPLGILNKMRYYISQYADATKKHCSISIEDTRKEFLQTEELCAELTGLELRYYQVEAADEALRQNFGIIAVPTSGGKTVIAAEIFRRKPTKTLFVVDRKILLTQTIKEFEMVLPQLKDKIGTIEEGTMNLKGNLTVATIQTIHSRVKRKDKDMLKYLEDVEMIISDEAHIAKANQYDSLFKNAINSRIRIGLTGTPADDAPNALELHKNLGYVIYRIPVQTLIDEGTVMRPTITFLRYDAGFIMEGDFNDIHEQLITNEPRNKMIVELCQQFPDKVVMILVHRISHGDALKQMLHDSGRECFFIQGAVDNITRESILADARSGHPRVIIGTSSIVAKGLNLKTLEVIINATGNATSIMTIQSLGRVLRMNDGKEQALFFDFYDELDYFVEHTEQRIDAFKKDGHEVTIK